MNAIEDSLQCLHLDVWSLREWPPSDARPERAPAGSQRYKI